MYITKGICLYECCLTARKANQDAGDRYKHRDSETTRMIGDGEERRRIKTFDDNHHLDMGKCRNQCTTIAYSSIVYLIAIRSDTILRLFHVSNSLLFVICHTRLPLIERIRRGSPNSPEPSLLDTSSYEWTLQIDMSTNLPDVKPFPIGRKVPRKQAKACW